MNHQIKDSLQRSVAELPHPSFEEIVKIPVIKMTEHDYITRQENNSKQSLLPMKKLILIVCLLFVTSVSVKWVIHNFKTDYIVTLDINPSFEMKINHNGKVIQLNGLNKDALALIEDENFKGKNIEPAIELLLYKLNQNNYFINNKNTILLSVRAKNKTETYDIQKKINDSIEKIADLIHVKPVIIYQELTDSEQIIEEAKKLQISTGKLQFIYEVAKHNTTQSIEVLSKLSMEELLNLKNSTNSSVSPSKESKKDSNTPPNKESNSEPSKTDKTLQNTESSQISSNKDKQDTSYNKNHDDNNGDDEDERIDTSKKKDSEAESEEESEDKSIEEPAANKDSKEEDVSDENNEDEDDSESERTDEVDEVEEIEESEDETEDKAEEEKDASQSKETNTEDLIEPDDD